MYAYTHSISIAWNFPPWEPHGRKASRQITEEAESGIFLLRGPRCSTRGRVAGRTVTGVRCSGLNLLGWVRHRSCDRPQQVFDQGTECCSNLSKNYTRQTLQPLHSIWCPDDAPLTDNNHSDLRNYFYLILLTFFLQKKNPYQIHSIDIIKDFVQLLSIPSSYESWFQNPRLYCSNLLRKSLIRLHCTVLPLSVHIYISCQSFALLLLDNFWDIFLIASSSQIWLAPHPIHLPFLITFLSMQFLIIGYFQFLFVNCYMTVCCGVQLFCHNKDTYLEVYNIFLFSPS